MLSITNLLGNVKPKLITQVETAIWSVVFSLAEGSLNPAQLLSHLAERLPWERIISAENCEYERRWFNLGKWYYLRFKFKDNPQFI